MGIDDVFEIDATVEEFVGLDVAVVVGQARRRVVVLFREEARRSQDEARQAVAAVEQLAQILRYGLRHAVNVPGDGPDVLGHPRRGRPCRRRQRPAEGAGRTREDEGPGAGRRGLLQEIERTRDVGIDEVLPAVSHHMGFMQRRRVEDSLHAPHALPDATEVGNRPDFAGIGGGR